MLDFEGENFVNFVVVWLFAKVFYAKFGGVVSSGGTIGSTSEQSWNVSHYTVVQLVRSI